MSGIGYIDHGVGCLNPDNYEARHIDDCLRCGGEIYEGGETTSGLCAWCECELNNTGYI